MGEGTESFVPSHPSFVYLLSGPRWWTLGVQHPGSYRGPTFPICFPPPHILGSANPLCSSHPELLPRDKSWPEKIDSHFPSSPGALHPRTNPFSSQLSFQFSFPQVREGKKNLLVFLVVFFTFIIILVGSPLGTLLTWCLLFFVGWE